MPLLFQPLGQGFGHDLPLGEGFLTLELPLKGDPQQRVRELRVDPHR